MRKLALRNGARDFCRDTEIWREELTFDSEEDEDEYDLNAQHSYEAEVYRVLTVTLDDSTIDAEYRTFTTTGILAFDSAPDADGDDIVVNTVMLPYRSCDTYPAWLLRRWGEAIAAKALANLKSEAGKPWTDAKGAQKNRDDYVRACGTAKTMVISGRESGNLRAQYRNFVS